jgi:ankyrin repeat protein
LWAAKNGHGVVARLLLEKSANVEAMDNLNGLTPLFIAAERGHEAVVGLLFEKGADIEVKN